MNSARIAGVVLAAGASRRLGTAKQLLQDEFGQAMVVRTARQLLEAGCTPVVVVTGAQQEVVTAALADVPVTIIHNADWAEGMGSSIRRGITWLDSAMESASIGAAIVAACDMPSVTSDHFRDIISASSGHLRRVASRFESPTRGMVIGIPALFPKADWTVLRTLSGDRGGRDLVSLPDTLSVFLRRGNFDIDTPADLFRWHVERQPHTPPHSPMSSAIAQNVLADLDHEIAQTRRVLERVPANHLDFRPHAKSWPLQKLANHLTDFPMWGVITLKQDVLDFAAPMPPAPPVPTTAAGFVAQFDERMASFRAALADATDAQMMETWTMKNGDAVIMAMPRIAVLRGMVVNHMIHHRAQMTIYFRLLDVPVPGLYGPSADEPM